MYLGICIKEREHMLSFTISILCDPFATLNTVDRSFLEFSSLGSCDTKIFLLIVLLPLLLFSATPFSVFSWTLCSLNEHVLKGHYVSGAELQWCCKYSNREDKDSPYPHKYYSFHFTKSPWRVSMQLLLTSTADNFKICM